VRSEADEVAPCPSITFSNDIKRRRVQRYTLTSESANGKGFAPCLVFANYFFFTAIDLRWPLRVRAWYEYD